jgi:hypothetical protein
MRYAAIVAILLGVGAAGYAGFQYANGGPPDQTENPSAASLAIPLASATLLVIGGVLLWVFVGKGYIASKGRPVRHRTGDRGSGKHPDEVRLTSRVVVPCDGTG